MRILLVSQMYPGPDAPDLGTFVAQVDLWEKFITRSGIKLND